VGAVRANITLRGEEVVGVCDDLTRRTGVRVTRKDLAGIIVNVRPELRSVMEEVARGHGPLSLEAIVDGTAKASGEKSFYMAGVHVLGGDGISLHGAVGARLMDSESKSSRDLCYVALQEMSLLAFASDDDPQTLLLRLRARTADNCSSEKRASKATAQLVTSRFGCQLVEFGEAGGLPKEYATPPQTVRGICPFHSSRLLDTRPLRWARVAPAKSAYADFRG
jgi:hypothetical protein